jgi:hypothetical protein
MVREAIAHAVPGECKLPVREKLKLTPATGFHSLCFAQKQHSASVQTQLIIRRPKKAQPRTRSNDGPHQVVECPARA